MWEGGLGEDLSLSKSSVGGVRRFELRDRERRWIPTIEEVDGLSEGGKDECAGVVGDLASDLLGTKGEGDV